MWGLKIRNEDMPYLVSNNAGQQRVYKSKRSADIFVREANRYSKYPFSVAYITKKEYDSFSKYQQNPSPAKMATIYRWGVYDDNKGLIRKFSKKIDARKYWKSLGGRPAGFYIHELKLSNPPKDKWIPAKAVKFNKNGSVSVKTSGSSTLGRISRAIEYKKKHPRAKSYKSK
jgi:hypothetical protein